MVMKLTKVQWGGRFAIASCGSLYTSLDLISWTYAPNSPQHNSPTNFLTFSIFCLTTRWQVITIGRKPCSAIHLLTPQALDKVSYKTLQVMDVWVHSCLVGLLSHPLPLFSGWGSLRLIELGKVCNLLCNSISLCARDMCIYTEATKTLYINEQFVMGADFI